MTDLGPAGASMLDRFEQHLIAGGELLRQNRLVDAQRELLAALETSPDSAKALALLGLAYFRGSRFAEALPVYRRLVASTPNDASYHLNLGLVLLKLGDADGAAAALERSRDLDPSQGRAVSYLGLAYARGGRFVEAYQAFLLAGQADLAREIADNLTPAERATIEASLRRVAVATTIPPPIPAPIPTPAAPVTESSRFVARGLAATADADADEPPAVPAPTAPAAVAHAALATAFAAQAAPAVAAQAAPAVAAQAAPAVAAQAAPAVAAQAAPAAAAADDDDHPVIVAETASAIDALAAARAEARAEAMANGGPAADAERALDQSDDDLALDAIEALGNTPAAEVPAAPRAAAPPTTVEPRASMRRAMPALPAIPTPARATGPLSPADERERDRIEREIRADREARSERQARIEQESRELRSDLSDLDGVVSEVALGAISRAVAQLAPSAAHGPDGRVAAGHRPPQPLSEFATTRLVRLEDGDEPFEISAGGVLIVRVTDKMFSRTEGVDVTGGQLGYEPALRRSRGQNRTEPFATDGRALFAVTGRGHLIAAPLGGQFTAVSLDDDIFYLREDLVFAFEPALRWENGHVPGSRERIPMVQFRGSGAVAFRTARPLISVKLAQERVLYVDATALAGWIGRVVPRAVTPADDGPGSELFVECTGEGVVLVEEEHAPKPAAP